MPGLGRHALALVIPLTWSGSFIAGTYATRELPALTVTVLRFAVCLAFLLPLLPRVRRGAALTRRDYLHFGLLGLLCVAAYHYFFFTGLRYTSPSMASVVLQTNPILINIGAALFLHETIRGRTYVGALIAFSGICLLALERGHWTVRGWGLGETLILAGSLCWVAFTLVGRPVFLRHNSLLVSIYAFAIGTALLVPVAWAEGGFGMLHALSARVWLSILYMGLFANVLGYLIYNDSVKHLGAGRTAMFTLLVTPLAAFWDRLFFGNPISVAKVLAVALVLFGVWLGMARARPRS